MIHERCQGCKHRTPIHCTADICASVRCDMIAAGLPLPAENVRVAAPVSSLDNGRRKAGEHATH